MSQLSSFVLLDIDLCSNLLLLENIFIVPYVQCCQLGTKCKKSSSVIASAVPTLCHPWASPWQFMGKEQSSSAWMGATLGEFKSCSRLCPYAHPREETSPALAIFSWHWTWRSFLKHRETPMANSVSDSFAAVSFSHCIAFQLCVWNFLTILLWQPTVFVRCRFYRGDFCTHDHYKNEFNTLNPVFVFILDWNGVYSFHIQCSL